MIEVALLLKEAIVRTEEGRLMIGKLHHLLNCEKHQLLLNYDTISMRLSNFLAQPSPIPLVAPVINTILFIVQF